VKWQGESTHERRDPDKRNAKRTRSRTKTEILIVEDEFVNREILIAILAAIAEMK
jgi:hypothetical protein